MASIGVIMLMKEHQAQKKRPELVGHSTDLPQNKTLTNGIKNDGYNHVIRTSMRLRLLTRAGQVHVTYK